jgi:hypothetical protein
VTGSVLVSPPGTDILQLAWQRVTPILSFPERNADGDYTLGYPFPGSVKIIYNGAVDACVKVQSLIKTGYSANGYLLERGVRRRRTLEV